MTMNKMHKIYILISTYCPNQWIPVRLPKVDWQY